jgi:hypothetical protein
VSGWRIPVAKKALELKMSLFSLFCPENPRIEATLSVSPGSLRMNCASGVAAICSLLTSPNALDVSNLAEQATPTHAIAQPLKRPPSIEFDSWSWGTTRRSWYQWFTATAAIESSLEASGWRLRATGGFGGYAADVKGSDAENVIASAMEVDDIALPHLGTVGKYYGSDGFVGAQIGYALIDRNWEVSG